MPHRPPHWRPSIVQRYIETRATSTRIIRVETDVGEGFVKALGNPEGPHALASEWVGTQLADWLGLPTLDYAIIDLSAELELSLGRDQGSAEPGPAFVTRAEAGSEWGGGEGTLKAVTNPQDVGRLIVFDTWIRNRDRYLRTEKRERKNPSNVWLSRDGQKGKAFVLKAIDHTHCFSDAAELSRKLADISVIQDERVFGNFPGFARLVRPKDVEAACASLQAFSDQDVVPILNGIPIEWGVQADVRAAWGEFLVRRARFVAETLPHRLFPPTQAKG